MSQPATGIPLTHAPSGIGYRLLEFPPELLSLLESSKDDDSFVLHLTTSSSPKSTALLHTPDGKLRYSLRQKNTSNGLILLQPSSSSGGEGETELKAIATLHETIELLPAATEEEGHSGSKQATATKAQARGKWHERFAKGR